MELEQDHGGSKWVISKVHADAFDPYFQRDTTRVGRFIHPMSHELDFMNLRKAFAATDSISQFTVKAVPARSSFGVPVRSKKGNLRFKQVDHVKFHFFQIDGWYFELSQFNRPGVQQWLANFKSCKAQRSA